ncbi:sugar ABC transporter substrate-binding protein [Telmatospirillum sp.]|uniref:ABC transporter substrate-binding protein n=1 Tax=Telmatospirillum sp. TaxID=2079197 RepID=UPI00283FE06D|nr:sugar ABC transporter substrate-binding protein [Telmatospirillum sp.]MDR3435763.1 sugar ABC transporter substrate-binding protein [Telmatospirillum sp.]
MTRFGTCGLTRRQFLAASAAATGLGIAGVRPAFADVNWRKFAGTTIEVNLITSPRGETLQRHQKEFEELTGIKVNSEMMPEQQQRQKAVIELTSGKPSFDVIHISYHVQKRQFEKGSWLADLTPFLKDPSLTEASFVMSDFGSAGVSFATDSKGAIGALPFSVDYWIVYWNKELFAKKNLSYPKTFEEMVAAAQALTDPKSQTYGFVARGQKNANVPVWTSFMLGYGSSSIDEKGKLLTDSPAAIEAAKLYQTLMTTSAPPGIAGFNWAESQSAFLQGKIGMWFDGLGFAPPLENPEKSRVVGKVGYGVMPKGPAAHAAGTTGDGIGVTAASTKKEAAYLYVQWALSKKVGADMLQTGSGVPFRTSIVDDPEVRKGVKMPAEWVDAIVQSAKISKLSLPVVIPVTEFRDVMGVALTNLLSGGNPEAEMRRATEEFRPILERSERT